MNQGIFASLGYPIFLALKLPWQQIKVNHPLLEHGATLEQKFQSEGASIVYVHTFCSELLGAQPTSLLDLCRSEMKSKCDVDVLSWFKYSPQNSPDMLSKNKIFLAQIAVSQMICPKYT